MLASNPPPSPAELLTFTAALASPSPAIRNLANKNCPPEISCQPAGTVQVGPPVRGAGGVALVTAPGIPPPGIAPPPIGGCPAGKAAGVGASSTFTDLRNVTKLGFCAVT